LNKQIIYMYIRYPYIRLYMLKIKITATYTTSLGHVNA